MVDYSSVSTVEDDICLLPTSALCESIEQAVLNEYSSLLFSSDNDFEASENLLRYQDLFRSETSDFVTPEPASVKCSNNYMPSINRSNIPIEQLLKSSETSEVLPSLEPFVYSDNQSGKRKAVDSENFVSNKKTMGIENTRNEDQCYAMQPAPEYLIPLPPPSGATSLEDLPNGNEFEGPENDAYSTNIESLFPSNEEETDTIDVSAFAGVCGIKNMGNTCFINSGLQCLAATTPLVQYFVKVSSTINLDHESLTVEFSNLVRKIWSGTYSSVYPVKFKSALGELYPQFKDTGQHDCQEFLALLLDALHQQILSVNEGNQINDDGSVGVIYETAKDNKTIVDTKLSSINNATTTTLVDFKGNDTSTGCSNDVLIDSCSNEDKIKRVEQLLMITVPRAKCDRKMTERVEQCEIDWDMVSGCKSTSTDITTATAAKDNINTENGVAVIPGNFTADDTVTVATPMKLHVVDMVEDAVAESSYCSVNDDNYMMIVDPPDKQPPPHEIRAHSYPPHDDLYYLYENNTNGKRGKTCNSSSSSTVSTFIAGTDFRDGFAKKKIKMNDLPDKNCNIVAVSQQQSTALPEENIKMDNERKITFVNNDDVGQPLEEEENKKEKQDTAETEATMMNGVEGEYGNEKKLDTSVRSTGEADLSNVDEDDNTDAAGDEHWQRVTSKNQSVIFDSFQGQFKNTVVCSVCNFKSITFEPFMYLSVPLPHAADKQLCVTFVPANCSPAVQYMFTLSKRDDVNKIKIHLSKLLNIDITYPLIVAEVLDHHIAKTLDDDQVVTQINDVSRKIYVIEQLIVDASELDGSVENFRWPPIDRMRPLVSTTNNNIASTCLICLEEKDSDIYGHCNCNCILCIDCIQQSCVYHNASVFKCPVCAVDVKVDSDLFPIEIDETDKSHRMLTMPVVYRLDEIEDGGNNNNNNNNNENGDCNPKITSKLFGHPNLLALPKKIGNRKLYQIITRINRYKKNFKLLLVDGQGTRCSRCLYNEHCRGCVISETGGNTVLQTDDVLAVVFFQPIDKDDEICSELSHSSMSSLRTAANGSMLTLNDCVQAFCQSEILDEYNPWFCSRCKKNQRATKTLSIRRYPKYLIVYLKRFIFHDCVSSKLEDRVKFPLYDFNIDHQKDSPFYDLYGCVCHRGGVHGGHYVAFTQHIYNKEWHCFNDQDVTDEKPSESQYAEVYILFYRKRSSADSDVD